MGVFLTLGFQEEHNPTPARLREVLDRLEQFEGSEGFGVSLTCDQTEWSLGTDRTGLVVWLNHSYTSGGPGSPRHLRGASREQVFALWCQLAAGHLAEIEQLPWLPGDG